MVPSGVRDGTAHASLPRDLWERYIAQLRHARLPNASPLGLTRTLSGRASIASPGPLKQIVRLCIGNQECYIADDPSE